MADAQAPCPTAAPASAAAPYPIAALAGLALAALLSSLGISIANIGLPAIGRAFDATLMASQWVLLGYLLAITVTVVVAGGLGDRIGSRRVLLGGLLLFLAGTALSAIAGSLALLIAARVVQGIGAAAMTTLAIAFAIAVVPAERRGSAVGLIGSTSAVGTAFGPALGGTLLAACGWRALFVALLPPALAALTLVARTLPPDPPRGGVHRPFDLAGALALVTALLAYALAMTVARAHSGGIVLALLLASAAGLSLFIRRQGRTSFPLVDITLLRRPAMATALAASMLATCVVMASLVVGPYFLGQGLGLDPARAGLVMAVGPVMSAVAGIPAGRLVDRHGSERVAALGVLAMALGAGTLSVLPIGFGAAGYVVPLGVLTAGYASFQAANSTALLRDAGPEHRGLVAGLVNLARHLGLISGVTLMAATFPEGADPSSAADGLHRSFAVALGLVLVAIAITRRHQEPERQSPI